jgi:hypothetical protein
MDSRKHKKMFSEGNGLMLKLSESSDVEPDDLHETNGDETKSLYGTMSDAKTAAKQSTDSDEDFINFGDFSDFSDSD